MSATLNFCHEIAKGRDLRAVTPIGGPSRKSLLVRSNPQRSLLPSWRVCVRSASALATP